MSPLGNRAADRSVLTAILEPEHPSSDQHPTASQIRFRDEHVCPDVPIFLGMCP